MCIRDSLSAVAAGEPRTVDGLIGASAEGAIAGCVTDSRSGAVPGVGAVEQVVGTVVDRPVSGRIFFEHVIRDNLDVGRPDQVSLIFDRRLKRTGPGACCASNDSATTRSPAPRHCTPSPTPSRHPPGHASPGCGWARNAATPCSQHYRCSGCNPTASTTATCGTSPPNSVASHPPTSHPDRSPTTCADSATTASSNASRTATATASPIPAWPPQCSCPPTKPLSTTSPAAPGSPHEPDPPHPNLTQNSRLRRLSPLGGRPANRRAVG